ncbi:hypothetical protein [Candidatus Kuenenia sp.]|uniref:hypothetical protein n=1 Tax=Candidatus Kuenenia sp. TaxID=2499824 RepID=UPI003220379E
MLNHNFSPFIIFHETKMKSFIASITFIVIFVLSGNVLSEENKRAEIQEPSQDAKDNGLEKQDNEKAQKVKYVIDFSNYSGGSVRKWLESKGLYYKGAAKYPAKIEFSIHDGALFIKTKQPVRGFLVCKDIILPEVSKVRIEWGIIKYPKDASFERENRTQALGLYIFFGPEKLSSGYFMIPDLPYFLSLFLGEADEINIPYKGKYFQAGGRYVCVGNPELKETVISEFDLTSAFRTYYEKESPAISGLCLEVDTTTTGGGGKAEAYIKRIEFLE